MRIVYCTTPKNKADEIAGIILEAKLAACVNIVGSVISKYWWEGKIETEEESLLIIKTRKELIDELIEKIREVHPYDVPEVISFKIEEGNKDYLDWIKQNVFMD